MSINNSALTVLILSCDRYSDLWDGHVKMLRKHWTGRCERAVIVSESSCGKNYDDIEIFEAGMNTEFSERLYAALKNIKTGFVLIVLDDYYLSSDVKSAELVRLVDIMEKENISYLRLYSLPREKMCIRDSPLQKTEFNSYIKINTEGGDTHQKKRSSC